MPGVSGELSVSGRPISGALAKLPGVVPSSWLDGFEQAAQVGFTGFGRVGDGGAVGKFSTGAYTLRVTPGEAVAEADISTHLGLQRVTADNLTDIHEHRHVNVAQPDQVCQHLVFPVIANAATVIQLIPVHGFRADTGAGGQHRAEGYAKYECPVIFANFAIHALSVVKNTSNHEFIPQIELDITICA